MKDSQPLNHSCRGLTLSKKDKAAEVVKFAIAAGVASVISISIGWVLISIVLINIEAYRAATPRATGAVVIFILCAILAVVGLGLLIAPIWGLWSIIREKLGIRALQKALEYNERVRIENEKATERVQRIEAEEREELLAIIDSESLALRWDECHRNKLEASYKNKSFKFYVYFHRASINSPPLYIGKGTRYEFPNQFDRAFSLERSNRRWWRESGNFIVEIAAIFDDELSAYNYEAEKIIEFSGPNLTNGTLGGLFENGVVNGVDSMSDAQKRKLIEEGRRVRERRANHRGRRWRGR